MFRSALQAFPSRAVWIASLGALFLTAGCRTTGTTVANDAALGDEANADDWLAFGRTYSEQRFSPLTQITDRNVAQLGVDWYLDLPDDRGLVSTPLVADGVMYFVGSMNAVRAVDATTGALRWKYDPEVMVHAGNRMRAGWDHSRGIALWNGKIYVATWDGRLNAIDATTGREVWSTMTVDPEKALYLTGAPKVFKGKVLIGNGGTEIGPARGSRTGGRICIVQSGRHGCGQRRACSERAAG